MHYATLGDDDLRFIAVKSADLLPDATMALTEELRSCGISDLAQYMIELEARERSHAEFLQKRLDKVEKRHRLALITLYVVAPFLILFSLWDIYIKGDKDNGEAMLVASIVGIPVSLCGIYFRR